MAAIGGIDHLVIVVADLDRAEAAYRKLGFILSPRAQHSDLMGTANHTIMLQDDYFELLGIRMPTESNIRWREALSHAEGLAGLATQTFGAPDAQAAWRAQGFAPSDVRAFARAVTRSNGMKMEAKFEMTSLPNGTLPGASIFACAQLTRDAVWLPELMDHPNTAQAIRKFTIATPDPAKDAAVWERALPASTSRAVEGGMQIRVARNAIDFIDPKTAGSRFGFTDPEDRARAMAIEFGVKDVATCRAALAKIGVTARTSAHSLMVSAKDACGVTLDFVAAEAPLQ
jgi:hypothetical protein